MKNRPQFARVGPVHFQPLEQELMPVRQYLKGHMLNAGCGNRDIDGYFGEIGVEKVTNYDISSSIPNAITGPLESMPFVDEQFDSILCNAVLEHVAPVDAILRELIRVLRPGGFLVLAVPFLQPLHECPGDFRRYTEQGLASLGESAGMKTVTVLPVHSMTQTLGWIAWEIACEKGGLLKFVLWPLIFVSTRFWNRTDTNLLRNANTYQAVFLRP